MNRREFITLLGGAAAWPIAVRAQSAGKLPTIGLWGPTTPSIDSQRVAAFVQRLRELGWIEGRTVKIEYRWAGGRNERAAEIAAEFVRLKVDVIVTQGTPSVLAAKQATSVIPIVFAAVGDPVDSGLVASLSRPGGNVTGLSTQQTDTATKRIELFRSAIPPSSWSCARFSQQPARSASRPPHSNYGERRISRPSSTRCLRRSARILRRVVGSACETFAARQRFLHTYGSDLNQASTSFLAWSLARP
jgi:ABC transporter substrate binding protein